MAKQSQLDFVIAGGGTAGWIAAALLARFTPPGTRIQLVESDAIGAIGVGEATIPQIHLLNNALGLDEREFLRETRATFKLGIEFDGWLHQGSAYMHAFGPIGRSAGILPFQHYWLRGRKLGLARQLRHYSLNETAARALRMQCASRSTIAPEMPYAFHFDAGLYAAFLRRYAEARGVVRHEGRIAQVERNAQNADIAALQLDDDRRIEGKFFIDCTGFQALLIEGALKTGFDDWSRYLPCNRAMTVACATGGDFTPYTRSMARKAGWQWRIPLQHRIGNGYVYCSDHLSDDDAAQALLDNLDGKAAGSPRPISFVTGKRRRHWNRNCLAVGLSAGFLEPLESTSIHLIQSAMSRFLSLLPVGAGDPALIEHFNMQADFEWERVRDFIILHYWANRRVGEPFWDRVRAMELPLTLQRKINQWQAAGFIHREHEELFTEVGWFQVLVGQAVEANSYNRGADRLSDTELSSLLENTEAAIAREAEQMPEHAQFLKDYMMHAPAQGVPA